MNKKALLKDLTKLANKLDERGEYKVASALDEIINKTAQIISVEEAKRELLEKLGGVIDRKADIYFGGGSAALHRAIMGHIKKNPQVLDNYVRENLKSLQYGAFNKSIDSQLDAMDFFNVVAKKIPQLNNMLKKYEKVRKPAEEWVKKVISMYVKANPRYKKYAGNVKRDAWALVEDLWREYKVSKRRGSGRHGKTPAEVTAIRGAFAILEQEFKMLELDDKIMSGIESTINVGVGEDDSKPIDIKPYESNVSPADVEKEY